MERESTNFFNYGTFKNSDADILKPELEKQGIPVKVHYPGTNVGREATAGAYWYGYTLMIRACDFKLADEIRKKLNIKPLRKGESMYPQIVPNWVNKPFSKYCFIGFFIFGLGSLIFYKLQGTYKSLISYFAIAAFILFFLWLASIIYQILQEKS